MLGTILWAILIIIIVVWLIGFFVAQLGNLVHILLVIALIILIYNLVAGRRR